MAKRLIGWKVEAKYDRLLSAESSRLSILFAPKEIDPVYLRQSVEFIRSEMADQRYTAIKIEKDLKERIKREGVWLNN